MNLEFLVRQKPQQVFMFKKYKQKNKASLFWLEF